MVRAHPRGLQHRPDQRRLGRCRAGPLRLRRDALLRALRLPAQPAVVPRRGARAARRPRPATTSGSAPCGSCRSTGSWSSWRSLVDPANDDADLAGLGQPPDPHPALPATTCSPSSLTQMWSLCTEVAFYLVLPLLCLALIGRRRRGSALAPRCWSAPALLSRGRRGLAGRGRPDPRLRGPLRAVAARLPAVVHGRHGLRGGLGQTSPCAPRDHVLERLGHDLTGCWILAAAVFALACSPAGRPAAAADPGRVGGRHQGRAVRRRGRVLRAAAGLRPRARGLGARAS